MTPSQIIHAIHGSLPHAECSDLDAFTCWVCGGASTRGQDRERWMGQNFTGQNRARSPASTLICEACVTVMAGRPPYTERMWSHLVEGRDHVRVNKGGKPAMREFLRRAHVEPWFAAIADTGQKHIIPWCPVNAPNQAGGAVAFEETLVELPRDAAGWALLDEIASLLTSGATKEEMAHGGYGARAWQLCGPALRAFEERRGPLRGGGWFDLALWLAQRDEASVAERMAKEKEDNAAKRDRKRETAHADRGGRARTAKRVPADARVQRAQALGSDPGPNAERGAIERDARGVADDHDSEPATGSSAAEQLSLLS